jgi:hypothetical protein
LDFKNRLILFFILIAVIPIAALSAVFTLTVIEFKEQISNVYSGFVSNMDILQKNKGDLLNIRTDLTQYAGAANLQQKAAAISQMKELKDDMAKSLGEYKKIQDLPGGFRTPGIIIQPVSSFNVAKLATDENLLVSRIGQQWKDYGTKVDDLAILSTDPTFASQASASATQLVTMTDKLVESYNALIALNTDIGNASKEQSQLEMQAAFFYGGIASAISAACATAAAILVSKRVVLGDLVRMSKLELVETSLRDLIGGGADALVAMVKSQMTEEEGGEPVPRKAEAPSAVVSSESEDVIIGKARVKPAEPAAPSEALVGEEAPRAIGLDCKGKLLILNAGNRLSPNASAALDSIFEEKNLVVLTRKGSNVYHRAQGQSTVYVLAQSAPPGAKEPSIPLLDEARLAQAIEGIMRENPSAIVLVDSATELIYTLGFEQVFSFLRKISEAVSSYENSGVVILINKKAHEPRVIEALGNVANELVD